MKTLTNLGTFHNGQTKSSLAKVLFSIEQTTGIKPKKSGSSWSACCPAHDDRRPSLSIKELPGGKVLLKCHKGCKTAAVLQSVGLTLSDLFADAPSNGRVSQILRSEDKTRPYYDFFLSPEKALAHLELNLGRPSYIWTYENDLGDTVGMVVRWNKPEGKIVRPISKN